MFLIPGPCGRDLIVMAADGSDPIAAGWEHVSVSLQTRTPNWPEMCFVKKLFWAPEDCVVQFHPPQADYISVHNYCLHLWRPTRGEFLMPPKELIA